MSSLVCIPRLIGRLRFACSEDLPKRAQGGQLKAPSNGSVERLRNDSCWHSSFWHRLIAAKSDWRSLIFSLDYPSIIFRLHTSLHYSLQANVELSLSHSGVSRHKVVISGKRRNRSSGFWKRNNGFPASCSITWISLRCYYVPQINHPTSCYRSG